MKQKMEEKKTATKTDILWGIDRYVDSPMRGKLVAPLIHLREAPGPSMVVQSLPHNTEVEVIKKQVIGYRTFYLVKELHGEKKRGWVLESLLKDIGGLYEGHLSEESKVKQ